MPILLGIPTYRATCAGCDHIAAHMDTRSLASAESMYRKLGWKPNIYASIGKTLQPSVWPRAASGDLWYCPACVKIQEDGQKARERQAREREEKLCPACMKGTARAHTEEEKAKYHPHGDFRGGSLDWGSTHA